MPAAGDVGQRHPGQGALADPRRAAEQDQRAGHQPAAEHAVELGDPGAQPLGALGLHVAQRHRLRAAARRFARPPRPARAAGALTCSSVFQAPQPEHCPVQVERGVPALRAAVLGAFAGHPLRLGMGDDASRGVWHERLSIQIRFK